MAEKYPSQHLPDQTTASEDQYEPMKDQYGIVVDRCGPMRDHYRLAVDPSEPTGDQHGQVAEQTNPDPVQRLITDQASAQPYAQTTAFTGTQKISQADIRIITHKAELQKAELDNLFEELGISAADIDNGRRNADTTDFKLQSSAVLRAWVQKKGKYATRNEVIKALRECGLNDAAGFLEKKFSESETSDVSTESAAIFELHKCQEELRAYYLQEVGKVNMLPWIPEDANEMESIFVDLELVRKKESKESQHIKSNEDLTTLKANQGQRVNRVLVTGDAGSGKSPTASNLAYKWAKNDLKSPLSKFALVFLIRMKDIEDSNLSLVDLIFQNILPEDSNVPKEGLSMYMKENAEVILFIIDGMDEDSAGVLKNKSSGINKLLHNRKLRKACVVLTSRPESISDLEMYACNYTQVKLAGFSLINIKKYVVNFFEDDMEKVDLLFRKFEAEPHILALASIPVLLLMICLLWEDQHITPKTKTQLYQKTITYLWRRYKARIGGDSTRDEDSDNEEFDEELKDLVNKLGELALNNVHLYCDKFIFTVKEFGRAVCDLGCQVGLLKREQSRAGLKRNTSIAFLHATFQEFCAAFHLVYLLDTKQKNLAEFDGILFKLSEDAFMYNYVLQFCCGIQPEVTNTFIQVLIEHDAKLASESKEPIYVDVAIFMKFIFEGQLTYEECSKLIPLFSSDIARIALTESSHGSGLIITTDLIPSVLYMLELYKSSATQTGFLSTIESLWVSTGCTPWLPTLLKHTSNLNDCVVVLGDSGTVIDLRMMYKALSELLHIKKLALMCTALIHRFDATNLLKFLTEKRVKLSLFRLFGFQFDENVMVRYLSSTSTSIKNLGLSGTLDARGQFPTINNVIKAFPRLQLKHLDHLELSLFQISSAIKCLRPIVSQLGVLTLCSLQERHLQELFSFLSKAQKLKSINLSENLLSVAAIQALVESLKTILALETLVLRNTGLNDESAGGLARFVRERSSINCLCLENNPGIGIKGENALRGLPLKRQVLDKSGVKYENIDTL